MTETAIKVTRRGFNSRNYPVPDAVKATAEQAIEGIAQNYADCGDDPTDCLAQLRTLAYIGEPHLPGYALNMHFKFGNRPGSDFALVHITMDGRQY